MRLLLFLLAAGPCFSASLLAQAGDSAAPRLEKLSLIPLPIVYYTPETRWAFGGAGFLAFRFAGEPAGSRPSQVQAGGAYTLERQVLAYASWRTFRRQERLTSFGEIGYYRYTYFYFGIGNDPAREVRERYGVVFPRLRWQGLRRFGHHAYLGLSYWYDGYAITETEAGGQLADMQAGVPGRDGGQISGPGIVALHDSRDHLFYPSRGSFGEAYAQLYGRFSGSAFAYRRLRGQYSRYFAVGRQVLAVQFFADLTWGEVPFYAMAQVGGNRQMRGYYEGRYRDKALWGTQAELRSPLFWRLGAAAFGGLAAVAPTPGKLPSAPLRFAGGGGLRFLLDPGERINIRFDAGFGPGSSGYYLTIGEAF
jgi:hypothetical protein